MISEPAAIKIAIAAAVVGSMKDQRMLQVYEDYGRLPIVISICLTRPSRSASRSFESFFNS